MTEGAKRKLNIPLLIALVVIIAGAGYAAYYFTSQDKALKERTESALKEESVPIDEDNIIGSYDIRMISGEEESSCTGFIDTDALGECILHILSEYEPRVLHLIINGDGTVTNDELGNGSMSYKTSVDKTTITFVNGNMKCVLTR